MNNNSFLQVTLPANSGPGQSLLVQAPDGRTISAVVPQGCLPGQTFYVQAPPPDLAGIPVNQQQNANQTSSPLQDDGFASGFSSPAPHPPKQKNRSQEMKLLQEKGLVKVKVPRGLKAGDRFKVRIVDGRTVNAVVPSGNVFEFYLKVPGKKQNWHDNPLAYAAPMVVGPFLI